MQNLSLALSVALLVGCGGSSTLAADADTSGGIDGSGVLADADPNEDLDMQAADFACIKDGTKVRKYFVDNRLGHLTEALAVANSPTGGTFPVGTIIQLIPQEAMVKRGVGWDATTNDWEFFALNISGTSTTITSRGAANTTNAFGGNCFDCHTKAAPQWDLICETNHGCDPLQINDSVITSLQDGDTRCP